MPSYHTFTLTPTPSLSLPHTYSPPHTFILTPPLYFRRAIALIEEDARVNGLWQSISTHDRRTIFDDVVRKLRSREMEQEREMRERCKVKFSALVESMPSIVYNTTWKEVKELLV